MNKNSFIFGLTCDSYDIEFVYDIKYRNTRQSSWPTNILWYGYE